jgi:transposase
MLAVKYPIFNMLQQWIYQTDHKADSSVVSERAEVYSFGGNVWTASQVAEVIDSTFCVRYYRVHMSRLLREAGWSRQQPIERAKQRRTRPALSG